MKEITRVHIAKQAYDIEVGAKKDLEQYMERLELYAGDAEILADIEIRMTELLAEHGTTKDGVITMSDIAVLRERLGEPEDFAEDGDVTALPARADAKPRRRLYRDQDKAVLGGVLSGMATYLGINPLWTRLIFIVLLIPSFGTMLILYAVLWIALPPARTAAEKLELEGKPVTLAAIKQRSEAVVESVKQNTTAQTVQKVLLFCLGVFFSVAAVGALIAVATASALVFGIGDSAGWNEMALELEPIGLFWLSYGLFVLSGLLFAALNAVLATATFTRHWTKRIGIAVVSIILAGIVAFSGAVGSMRYGGWQARETIRQSMTTTDTPLPVAFAEAKKLTIDTSRVPSIGSPAVIYIVSEGTPRAELSHPKNGAPKLDVTQHGDEAKLTVSLDDTTRWYQYHDPVVRVYGPALDELAVHGGGVKYTTSTDQDTLSLVATGGGSLSVEEGRFEAIHARTEAGSRIDLDHASIRTLNVVTDGGSVEAGVVRSLSVSQPDACPASSDGYRSSENMVEIEGVSSGEVNYNGSVRAITSAQKLDTPCGVVVIGDEDEFEDQ